MIFILGASSFRYALEKLPAKAKKRYAKIVYTSQGLSFNPSCKNPRKNAVYSKTLLSLSKRPRNLA